MNAIIIEWVGTLGLLGGLLWLSVIDWQTYRLPNRLTKPLIFFGLIYNFKLSLDVYPYLLGAVLGYAIFWVVETTYRLIRKQDGLGRGDAKLLAVGGAWCGAMALPFIILIASGTALAYVLIQPSETRANLKLPFGPFLAAAIAVIFIGSKFI
jgi:prepilin signal peptidase PulO-like enzyme (type II secretory pathway)